MIQPIHLAIILLICLPFTTFSQSWKTYPYHEENTELFFPADEGYHPGEPIEWWYTNARVTGATTGNEYSFMLTYFYYPGFGFDGFRILNLANDTEGTFYDETVPCWYPGLSEDHLDIQASVFGGGAESWRTLTGITGELIPFQYNITAGGQHGSIDVYYNALKPPLMVGGTGFLYQGLDDYTYYYSQTALEVNGMLTIDGFTEPVSGIAWIDRQWGSVNPNEGEQYEWFSLQLSNGTDINLWNFFTEQNEIPDTSTYRILSAWVNDTTSYTISDFDLERQAYVWMPDDEVCYARQWRLTADSPEIDLVITSLHEDHEVELPFRFYEGVTTIEGFIDGQAVTGDGFAELLRHYEDPDITFLTPNDTDPWDASIPISWELLDPDDGRSVYYDLEVSDDDKATYDLIAEDLTATEFLWDPVGYSPDSLYWFRLTGRSVDGTLMTVIETQVPQMITDASEVAIPGVQVAVFPNPATEIVNIRLEKSLSGKVQVNLSDLRGQRVRSTFFDKAAASCELSLTGIPSGIYLLEILDGKGTPLHLHKLGVR